MVEEEEEEEEEGAAAPRWRDIGGRRHMVGTDRWANSGVLGHGDCKRKYKLGL